jgi:type I restriction enzyme R subunit
MTPEQKSRQQIDRQLEQAGWIVQDYRQMNISAGPGVAVREFPLSTGFADYLLYADAKAIGSVEAKPQGFGLTGVAEQSAKYSIGLPKTLPYWELPLPFAYESTGSECRFINRKEQDARSRSVFSFHRPEELVRLAKLDKQVRTRLRELPPLSTGNLWHVQTESIKSLEKSLALNKPRALIQMATGSGKTYTAVNFCYRLIKYAGAKRILFLVDRNNLGKQTLNEFQQFFSPINGYKFTEEYTVQHLKKNTIAPASKVCITTIQRLYSMLKGEEDFQEEHEEGSLFETESSLVKEPLPVVYNSKIPIEAFDFIVVDECHRSIYNIWRQVLEYFDASLIGLTATPTKQTIGFFGGNLVQDYSHEQAVVDGVNVGYDVYRIETKITKDGAKLAREPGIFVPHRDRRTKGTKYKELDDDLTYTANRLDRDVVSENQIRLVMRTFKDKLPEIFPGRTEVPKTLVFAKTDLHAEDIVRIIREEFGKGNDFCQKITSKSTGKKPDELLSDFRNSYFPRIAVTVDMIATGTDVKPLECLIFMRNIRSLGYFEQMKGRGCRVVDPDVLQSVTPDARHKTHFVIVDAVGVCEDEKSATKPMDRKPSVPLDKILNLVAAGAASDDLVSTLASRLSRLDQEVDPIQQAAIVKASGGKSLSELSADLIKSIDPDVAVEAASRRFHPIHGDEVGFFAPNEPIAYLDGNLPHWRQDGVTYYVTFRTGDSIPQEKLRRWTAERDVWLQQNPEPHSPEQKKEYWKLFPKRIHDWLDAGYGECLLKDPSLRKIVVEALLHFAEDRYLLREWVVMPNHVHIIVTPLGDHQLSDILHSWKSFTAKEINKRLERKGAFWQKESFDHIIRSAESLDRIGAYIAANPDGLSVDSYSLSADAQMRRDAASTVDAPSSLVTWMPTERQIDEVEREQMATALKAFHDPKLREAILAAKRSLVQIIDEQTPDQLLRAGFDAEALEKAKSMLTSFRQFIEDNKDEIEALQVMYSVPYRAGLKFHQVKDLASKLNQPPFFVDPNQPESLTRLWQAFELVEPDKVKGKGGRKLVDVIAMVRHAMDPNTPLTPMDMTVEERYHRWMAEKQRAGVEFTADQRKWLDAIKDHIAASLAIEQEDLEEVPFNAIGGLGRAYQLFGEHLASILEELNVRLAA